MNCFEQRFAKRVQPLVLSGTAAARLTGAGNPGSKFDLASGQLALDVDELSQRVIDEAVAAVSYSYGPAAGFARLREAIAARSGRFLTEAPLESTHVLVAPGAKNALFGLCTTLVDEGDHVLIASPHWGTFAQQIRLCGGTPISLVREVGETWHQALSRSTNLRTRVLIVNTPSNPTGEVIESAALVDLITVCAHAKIHVILDLSYREIVFDDRDRLALPSEFVSNGHVTIVESFSKTTRLPGWRIGHVLGHAALISKLEALATHMNSGASVLCQAGVLALMESGAIDRLAESSRAHVMANVALVEQLDDNLRAVMPLPKGGFFSLLELPHDGHGRPVDCARAQQLLFQSRGVMTTAGKHFGAPGTLRISFGASLGDVAAGLRGVRNFLDELQANPGLMDCA